MRLAQLVAIFIITFITTEGFVLKKQSDVMVKGHVVNSNKVNPGVSRVIVEKTDI